MKISGHDKIIQGNLLTQYFDDSGDIAFAYERSISYSTDFHAHDWHMLVFPKSASEIEFTIESTQKKVALSENHFLWMPANTIHKQRATTMVWDAFALYIPHQDLVKLFKAQGLKQKEINDLLLITKKFSRSDFLNQLIGDLFLHKVVKDLPFAEISPLAKITVEKAIAKLCNTSTKNKNQPVIEKSGSIASRAVDYIEQNLFSDFSTSDLSSYCGTSSATLFRHFKKEFAMTPFDYLRIRRLEQAKILLKRGENTAEEVMYLVGYNDYSAFSKSFKAHFKVSPSSLKA